MNEKSSLYDSARQLIRSETSMPILAAALIEANRDEECRRSVLLNIIEPYFGGGKLPETAAIILEGARNEAKRPAIAKVFEACGITSWTFWPSELLIDSCIRVMEPTPVNAKASLLYDLLTDALTRKRSRASSQAYLIALLDAAVTANNETCFAVIAEHAGQLSDLIIEFVIGKRLFAISKSGNNLQDESNQAFNQTCLARAVCDKLPEEAYRDTRLLTQRYAALPILGPGIAKEAKPGKELNNFLIVWAHAIGLVHDFDLPYVRDMDNAGKGGYPRFQQTLRALELTAKSHLLQALATSHPAGHREHGFNVGTKVAKGKDDPIMLVSNKNDPAVKKFFQELVTSGQARENFVHYYALAYGKTKARDDVQQWLLSDNAVYSGHNYDFQNEIILPWKLRGGIAANHLLSKSYHLAPEDVSTESMISSLLSSKEKGQKLLTEEPSQSILLEHGFACRVLMEAALSIEGWFLEESNVRFAWRNQFFLPAVEKRPDLQRLLVEMALTAPDQDKTGDVSRIARRILMDGERHKEWMTTSDVEKAKQLARNHWRKLCSGSEPENFLSTFLSPAEEIDIFMNLALKSTGVENKIPFRHKRIAEVFKNHARGKKRLREFLLKPEYRKEHGVHTWLFYVLEVFKDDRAFRPIIEEYLSSKDSKVAEHTLRLIQEYNY